jgi:hypothetical protein
MTPLVWKTSLFLGLTARKVSAVRGQYVISRDRNDGRYSIWHRHQHPVTKDISWNPLGQADAIDGAKAVAQEHANSSKEKAQGSR